MHPVFAQALAPFAPPQSSVHRKTPHIETWVGDVELVVEYDYTPGEAPVYDVDSPVCGPGHPAEVELLGVYVKGSNADIVDLLRDSVISLLQERVLLEQA